MKTAVFFLSFCLTLACFAKGVTVFTCTAHLDDKTFSLEDAGKKKIRSFVHDGKVDVQCPFRRTKVEDKQVGIKRVIGARYEKSGLCVPEVASGPASRKRIDLIVEITNGVATARFDDKKSHAAIPCELSKFQPKFLGIKN